MTIATTDQKKARLLDLTTGILEMARDGNRDYDEIIDVFQVIKEERDFATILGRNDKPAVPKPVPSLLEPVGTVFVPATIKRFLAREKFVLNRGRKAKPGVLISYLGDSFQEWFLEKIEEPIAETTLRYAKLTKSSVDAPIRAEIGSEFEETTLAQIYSLMERQKHGEGGVLLNSGWANIFYVKDVNGELRAVCVYWDDDGWSVGAGSVTDPDGWGGGRQVFSRNSSVAMTV